MKSHGFVWMSTRAVVALAVPFALAVTACSAQLEDARGAHLRGEYDQAIRIYARALENDSLDAAAWRDYGRALMDVGRYADAVTALQSAPSRMQPEIANTLGEAMRALGRLEEARVAFAAAERGADSLSARLNRAIMQLDAGDKAGAFRTFDQFIDVYNGASRGRLSSNELMAVATAVEHLGETDPELFKDALRAYDEAIAADPNNDEARLRLARLFLGKYNGSDAQQTIGEVLRRNPRQPDALLALGKAKEFEGSSEAAEHVRKALEVNPNLVSAHIFLTRGALIAEDFGLARERAERAVQLNPASLEALTMLATVQFLSGEREAYDQTERRILQLNPRYADLYTTLAELSVQTRQYPRAVELMQKAVALDSTSWRAHGTLGINLLRLGRIEDGRKHIEIAFRGDPYNVWLKNTLDLLDSMNRYVTTERGRFIIVADPREAPVLEPYITELASEAYDALSKRYKTQLDGKVRVELFNSHADFSVRTVGLAGLGALGASFGNLLTMDSPAAREVGQFNWGSTFWHELAHAFHLHLTSHKVPRWLTEGLATYEERRAKAGWGDDLNPGFLAAWKAKKLHPVSKLNNGFVRPEYPQQIGFSYYQASLVAEMIEQEYGFDTILQMLRGYRDGQTNEQVMRSVLEVEPEAFDKKFEAYIEQRFATQLAAVDGGEGKGDGRNSGSLADALGTAADLIREQEYDQAIPLLERAKQQFPEYAGPGGPYRLLAQIYLERGDRQKAAAELEKHTTINETDYEANIQLAELWSQLGNTAGAAAALERAMFIYPLQPQPHARLAELYSQLGDKSKVLRERKAIIGLQPADRAEAYYQLARAHYELGQNAEARRELLRALEAAPNYEKAQSLLLELRGSGR